MDAVDEAHLLMSLSWKVLLCISLVALIFALFQELAPGLWLALELGV